MTPPPCECNCHQRIKGLEKSEILRIPHGKTGIGNPREFHLINKTQADCMDYHRIGPRISGIVCTILIGVLRKSTDDMSFEEFAKYLHGMVSNGGRPATRKFKK